MGARYLWHIYNDGIGCFTREFRRIGICEQSDNKKEYTIQTTNASNHKHCEPIQRQRPENQGKYPGKAHAALEPILLLVSYPLCRECQIRRVREYLCAEEGMSTVAAN